MAKKEAANLEAYRADNRFKELQKEYDGKNSSKPFVYEFQSHDIGVKSRACYLPFEGRFDAETFDLFLLNTIPKELMFITDNSNKLQRAREFCDKNQLPVIITQAPSLEKNTAKDLVRIEFSRSRLEHSNCYKLQTQSAVKPVLIDDLLYKYLPL